MKLLSDLDQFDEQAEDDPAALADLVGVWAGSVSAVGIVGVVGALLLTYVRFVEEKT